MESLQGKSFEEGVKLLLVRTLKREGVFMPSIVVYLEDKKEQYNYRDAILTKPDEFIQRISG